MERAQAEPSSVSSPPRRDRAISSASSAFEDVADLTAFRDEIMAGVTANSERGIRRAARDAGGINILAALNSVDPNGHIALLEAASEGHDTAIMALHKLGCDMDVHNGDGQSAMHFAASHGHDSTLRLLVSLGADVDATTGFDETALHLASAEGRDKTVECLLALGADPNKAEQHDGWAAAHWAASGGHDATVELLWEAGAHLNQLNKLGQSPLFCAVLAGCSSMIRTLYRLGARIDIVAKNHTTLIDNALLLRDMETTSAVVHTLVDLKSEVNFSAVNECVGKKSLELLQTGKALMRAVIEQSSTLGKRECITSRHLRYILQHFPLEVAVELFDHSVLCSYSPMWSCLAIAMVLEEVAGRSVTKNHALRPHILTYVQRAVKLADKLHHPEQEGRSFRDTGQLTLQEVLEPDIMRLMLENCAIAELTPLEICDKYRYSAIFNSYVVTEYIERKWSGGRELQVNLRNLSDEIMERLSLRPSRWVLTARVVRFVVPMLLTITCADDSALTAAFTRWPRAPEVMRRIFSNQSVRARQFFSVPLMRFVFELLPQLVIILLFTYGSFDSGEFNYAANWNPEARLFGMSKKGPFRSAEWLFVFYVMGQLLAELKQIRLEGVKEYIGDSFNIFDSVLLLTFVVVIVIRVVANNSGAGDYVSKSSLQAIEILMGLSGILLWVRMLETFAIHRKLGPLLEMISKMFQDLVTFFGLVTVITMGFATAFHHLFHDIPDYSSWTRTWITLLMNLVGANFKWDEIGAMPSQTLATLGQVMLVLFILVGTILLLNLLIAILTDIFRRVAEELSAEHNFDKARLVQRVVRRSEFAVPPANLLQPLFFWAGSRQQALPSGYPVDALFTQQLSPLQLRHMQDGQLAHQDGVFVDAEARVQKSWHPAVVLRPPGGLEKSLNSIASASLSYLWYHVRFENDAIEFLNKGPVPIRARARRSLPMMLNYGRSEVRYLLDLLGSWPFAFLAANMVLAFLFPFLSAVMTWQLFGAAKRNIGQAMGWILLPLIVITACSLLLACLTLMVIVLLGLWVMQLVVSTHNIFRGGLSCNRLNWRRRKQAADMQLQLDQAARSTMGKGKAKSKGKRKGKGAGSKSGEDGMSSAAQQLEAARLTDETQSSQRWRQRRARCTYATREDIQEVLQSSVYAATIPVLDEKMGHNVQEVTKAADETLSSMMHAAVLQEEMEARTWEGLEEQRKDLRQIAWLVQKRRLARTSQGGKTQEAHPDAAAAGSTSQRRSALGQVALGAQLESKTLLKQIRRFEKDMQGAQRRRRSTKKSVMTVRGLRHRGSSVFSPGTSTAPRRLSGGDLDAKLNRRGSRAVV